MVIDLVAQASISMGIESDHSVQIHGGTVRVNDAFPNYLHAVLSICHMRVVPAHQTRALRDKKITTGRGVVDVGRHKGLQFSWQIRVQALLKDRRDFPSRFYFIGGQWRRTSRAEVVIGLTGTC